MTDINTSYNPQEFYKFLKALKNNANWQDKLVATLTKVEKPKLPKPLQVKNQKFQKHPDRIGSNESLISVKNEYSNKSVAFIYKPSIGLSESQSDENLFDNENSSYKCSEEKVFQSLPLLEMINEYESESPKKCVKIKPTPRVKSICKQQDDMHSNRHTSDKIHFDQKLESLLNNIISSSEKIRITMDAGITPPDGDEEWERRYSRAKEFYSRFSRNYLYRLGRQVTDLENYYIKCSGKSSNRTIENIQQHLLAVYSIILNALQAYHNHMSTSLSFVAIDKLMNIYENICKCCVIMAKFLNKENKNSHKFDYNIEEVSNISKDMVDKLAQILFETPQLYCITLSAAKAMRKGYKWEAKIPLKKKPIKKTKLDTRLSMYSMSSNVRTKNTWKKTVEDLTKDKFRYSHVESRYKTAVFKHRQPIEKPAPNTKIKIFDKRSSSLLRNTPLLTPDKEDDIVTMVELEEKREKGIHKPQKISVSSSNEKIASSKQADVLTSLIQGLCCQICAQDGKNVTENKLENLLKSLLGMALDGKINNTGNTETSCKSGTIKHNDPGTEKLDSENTNYQTNTTSSNSPHVISKSEQCNKDETDLNGYVDFIKNIRQNLENGNLNEMRRKMRSCTSLTETIESTPNCDSSRICLENQHKVTFQDDSKINSKRKILKSGKKPRRQTISVTGEKNAQLICIRDEDSIIEALEEENVDKDKNTAVISPNNNCISIDSNYKDKHFSKEVIKISRLPKKSFKKLELLPNSTMCDVIKYKIMFKKFSRQNPMYRKSPTIQPWEIVDLISENLLNELLLGVAREIEENDILKNIYESEFC